MKVNTVAISTVFHFSLHESNRALGVLVNGELWFLQGEVCVLQHLPIFVL